MTFIAPHYSKAKKKTGIGFFKKDHYMIKTPWWLKKFYPGCLWDMNDKGKNLYLTFDDGPHPVITNFILDELKKYDAKATFFCIGTNVEKNPGIFQRLIDEGHATGNHTQHHINGWKSTIGAYTNDVRIASKHIDSRLFRPPYGRMRKDQMKHLIKKMNMTIVMWNILAGDWDVTVSPEKSYQRIKNKISEGDIIVLHDSEKAWDRMSYILPRLLHDFNEAGYCFKKING